MKILMKQALGAVALSAMALSMIGANSVVAREKAGVVKPPPPPAVEIETGQMLDKGPRWKPSVSASANGLCGLPYTAPCATDASAVDVETGQKLIKDKPRANVQTGDQPSDPVTERGHLCDPHPSCTQLINERSSAPPPADDAAAPPSAERGKTDTIKPNPPSMEKAIGTPAEPQLRKQKKAAKKASKPG